jgi:PAS domain S-box-containing protein
MRQQKIMKRLMTSVSSSEKRLRLLLVYPDSGKTDYLQSRLSRTLDLMVHNQTCPVLPAILSDKPDIVMTADNGQYHEWIPALRTYPECRDIPVVSISCNRNTDGSVDPRNTFIDFDDYLDESMSDLEIAARIDATVNGARSRAKMNRRQQLLTEIDDATRSLSNPDEITLAAATLLGKYLNVNRCAYADVESDEDTFNLTGNYNHEVPSIVGRYTFAQFGAECLRLMRAGLPYIVEDSESDPRTQEVRESYRLTLIRSVICVPLMKSGRFVGAMAVHQKTPRLWQSHEAELLLQVANRCWESIERTRVSRELADNEARYRTLVETTSVIVWRIDIDGTAKDDNPSWGAFTGQDFEAYKGAGWLSAVHPDDQHALMEAWVAATKTQSRFSCQYRLRRHDGVYRFMDANGAFVRLSGERRGEWVGNCVDITEAKRAEEELRAGDQRKDEFLAMLAHELRNPMAPIMAAADLLQIAEIDEVRVRQTSEIIARQVKHMTALVDDLLDVSRVTRGLIRLENSTLDIKTIAAEAMEQVRPLMQAKGHHAAIQAPMDSALVTGDHKRLVQVVANLLNNAAKYTPAGGSIILQIETQDNHVLLSVKDNGIGMAPDVVERAFELFTQADRAIDRTQGGLGIGLALVKSLVELHDGSVTAFSKGIGQGSDFTIRLPRSFQKNEHLGHAELPPQTSSESRPWKILVVDDNADAADTMGMLLEALGYEVLVEYGSHDALKRARKDKPDICLLDIGLPEIDGNDLAQYLRILPETQNAILVAISGYGQEQDRNRAFEAGFNHHFAKPVDISKLAKLLREISKVET